MRVRQTRGAIAVATLIAIAACGSSTEQSASDTIGSAPATTTTTLPNKPTTTAGPAITASTPAQATTTSATTTTSIAPTTTAAPTTTTATTTTTSTIPPTTSTVPTPSAACVSALSIREQAALLVWPSVYSNAWNEAIETVASTGLGGVLLMRPDGWSADDVSVRLAELEAASQHGLIVATDEEGGDVQRLRLLGELASQRSVSTSMSPGEATDLVAAHGAAVRSVGVDMVLGPVVDVEPNVGEVPLRPSRFFVGDPDSVTAYAAAYLDGWARADLFSVLKHFPGHGAASGDTHITAGVTPSFADIDGWDLRPYRDLATKSAEHQTAVMIGHLTVPGLTDGVPATRSAAAIDYLRNDLGYGDALLITDALGMAAVGLPEPEASVAAIAAGIDIVIFTRTSQAAAVIDAIVAAVDAGTIEASQLTRSAEKVMTLLERDGHTCNQP